MIEDTVHQWTVFGTSILGSSHKRNNKPNQDAILWHPESGAELPIILAISDGHGSNKCFRSDHGSQVGVKVAIEVINTFLQSLSQQVEMEEIKRQAREQLPHSIVSRWKEEIEKDLSANPFSEAELKKLVEKDGEAIKNGLLRHPLTAYGATLLTVTITTQFVMYLQIGDGDILKVDSDGSTVRPLAKDKRLFANETTSLSMDNAQNEFHGGVISLLQDPPAMIIVSTDGYSNAFKTEEDFLAVGKDYLNMFRERGKDKIVRELPSFLEYASQHGSGDDVTLGIIKCQELLDFDKLSSMDQSIKDVDQKARSLEEATTHLSDHQTHLEENHALIASQQSSLKASVDILEPLPAKVQKLEEEINRIAKTITDQKEFSDRVNHELEEQRMGLKMTKTALIFSVIIAVLGLLTAIVSIIK